MLHGTYYFRVICINILGLRHQLNIKQTPVSLVKRIDISFINGLLGNETVRGLEKTNQLKDLI